MAIVVYPHEKVQENKAKEKQKLTGSGVTLYKVSTILFNKNLKHMYI